MDLSPDELDLISLAREGEDPSQAARRRMRSNVMAKVGLGAAAGATVATTTAAAQAGSSSSVLSIWAKLTLGAVLVGTVGGGGYVAVTSSAPPPKLGEVAPQLMKLTDEAHPSESEAPHTVESADVELTEVEEERSEPEARVTIVPSTVPASPAPAPIKTSSIKDELDLLRQAQQRLNGGYAEEALSMLESHQRGHPDGRLKQERMAVRVFALCKAGRRAEARAAARRFLAEAPSSPLAPRVARACAEPPKKTP